MTLATVKFQPLTADDPLPYPVDDTAQLRSTLLALQRDNPSLNFLVDVEAEGRDRISVVLAGDRGMATVWSGPVWNTVGSLDPSLEPIYVWDGAGIDLPGQFFVPIELLLTAVEEWVQNGRLSTAIMWLDDDETVRRIV